METTPMSQVQLEAFGRFGQAMAAGMQQKGMAHAAQLAKRVGVSREHIRKILADQISPSQPLCKVICHELGLDPDEAWTLCQEDRLQRKFGERLASRVTKKDHPRIEECRDMLVALTPVQYDAVLSVLRGFTGQQAATPHVRKAKRYDISLGAEKLKRKAGAA
jgi:transcriptional regulator with XRE-family HTH domain